MNLEAQRIYMLRIGNHRFLQDFVSAMQILMKDMIKMVSKIL